MTAKELFERAQSLVLLATDLENRIEEARTAAGPHGQRLGSIGGGGASDPLKPIDRLVDSGATEELRTAQERRDALVERCTTILYGKDGRGGLAKARSYADADILCCYYLGCMSWKQIAKEIVRPDSEDPRHWCMMRARRALEYIDKVGVDALVDL